MEISEDAFSAKMWGVRIVSCLAMANGVAEFFREPESIESFLSGSSEAWNDVFEWG